MCYIFKKKASKEKPRLDSNINACCVYVHARAPVLCVHRGGRDLFARLEIVAKSIIRRRVETRTLFSLLLLSSLGKLLSRGKKKTKKNENVPGKPYKNSNIPVQCPTQLFIINLSFLRCTSNAVAAIDR